MMYRHYYDEYRCPKCGSYDVRKTGWLEFVCNECGHVKKTTYEHIPHIDSFCPVVSSSGYDVITSYESDDKDEKK